MARGHAGDVHRTPAADRWRTRAHKPTRPRSAPLLVLDLNGTLVCRQKNKSGRSVPNGTIASRPYLQCFLRYCLGPLFDARGAAFDDAWPPRARDIVLLQYAPIGSHFWIRGLDRATVCEPPTTPIPLMIWSSAAATNVDRMLHHFTASDTQRALFLRVWSRETLVRARDQGRKVGVVKDLGIVWDDLNEWDMYMARRSSVSAAPRFRARALAQSRITAHEWRLRRADEEAARRERQEAVRRGRQEAVRRGRQEGACAFGSPPRGSPLSHSHHPYDDGAPRQRVHPDSLYNEALARAAERDAPHSAIPLHPWNARNTILVDDSPDKARCQPHNHMCIPEYGPAGVAAYEAYLRGDGDVGELDDALLQCVGIVDAACAEADVPAWLMSGAAHGIGGGRAGEWAARGRAALARRGIPADP
ncbi:hypothetical protein MSPP1_003033 [Malassezia sp. CBS 17886]|nr:hypothetical protein MSPP1_003033 [Malassezia sp. CBS 17886]